MVESGRQSVDSNQERRTRPDLRRIFSDVVACVEPFVARGGLNGQPAEYWAIHAVSDRFPQLAAQDARTLVDAALRYLGERGR
jgi:hypothetical protein